MKRFILCISISILTCFFSCCPTVSSSVAFTVGCIRYNRTSSTEVEVIKNDTHPYSGAITIPAKVIYENKTYNVVRISFGAFEGAQVTTVHLPEGLKTIEKDAFKFSTLTEIKIPNSTTTIGKYSFYGNEMLKRVELSSGMESIEEQTFAYCKNLSEVIIPEGIKRITNSFWNCISLYSITLPRSLKECTSPFDNCSNLGEIIYTGNTVLFRKK
ncbi:leucine-rich repeat domain-containing protein [Bacteroides sp. 519]|uniref:leucine-rich repeat domain-containing protein n=1 Tax=Bacteroides sp. 519 TaxID=2302937 RepID=UPI0013D42E05|nr:leucine-rich repeat domain-containing protein [Bacteroides sp. 519]NDV59258.1 leucine-rich repeat domain-containing protein [Bacteroides sp. 519]